MLVMQVTTIGENPSFPSLLSSQVTLPLPSLWSTQIQVSIHTSLLPLTVPPCLGWPLSLTSPCRCSQPWRWTRGGCPGSSSPLSQSPWLVTTTLGSRRSVRTSVYLTISRYRVEGSATATGSGHVTYLSRPCYNYKVPSKYGFSKYDF